MVTCLIVLTAASLVVVAVQFSCFFAYQESKGAAPDELRNVCSEV